jgi:hypothetical protein
MIKLKNYWAQRQVVWQCPFRAIKRKNQRIKIVEQSCRTYEKPKNKQYVQHGSPGVEKEKGTENYLKT